MSPTTSHRKLTPPEIAELLRVKPERVRAWIRSGRLRAIDVSQPGSTRPRFRIDPADLEKFEASLVVSPPRPKPVRRRKPEDVIEFF
jgi:excisionase family DNA binding protein